SEDKFDISDLCFASNTEPNMFDESFNGQPQIIEETNDLTAPKTETNEFTDSEEELYPLTKEQSFID
ncbi:31587_t:CDS:1, partial [Racocetra persica]